MSVTQVRLTREGFWPATFNAKRLAKESEEAHGMCEGSLRTVMSLFPRKVCGFPNPHTEFLTAGSELYKYHIDHTTDWDSPTRALRDESLNAYLTEMERLRQVCNENFRKFLEWMPEGKRLAATPEGLNGQFDSALYKDEDRLLREFHIHVTTEPITRPEQLWGGLMGDMIEKQRQEYERNMAEREENARHSSAASLLDRMKDFAQRMANPEARNIESMIQEVTAFAQNIPAALNISGDAQLDQAANEAASILASIDVEAIRKDEANRKLMAKLGTEFVNKYAGIGQRKF